MCHDGAGLAAGPNAAGAEAAPAGPAGLLPGCRLTNSLSMSSVTTLLLPLSCGGSSAAAAGFAAGRAAGACLLVFGRLLAPARNEWPVTDVNGRFAPPDNCCFAFLAGGCPGASSAKGLKSTAGAAAGLTAGTEPVGVAAAVPADDTALCSTC